MDVNKLKEWLEGQMGLINTIGIDPNGYEHGLYSGIQSVLIALSNGRFDRNEFTSIQDQVKYLPFNSANQRYELAKAAMEGMLSKSDDLSYESVAKSAIAYADEMIKQLNAEKK